MVAKLYPWNNMADIGTSLGRIQSVSPSIFNPDGMLKPLTTALIVKRIVKPNVVGTLTGNAIVINELINIK